MGPKAFPKSFLRPLSSSPDRDSGVDVGRPVQGVEHHDVLPRVRLLDGDGHVLLLRGQDAGAARAAEAVGEDLVGHNVQLLLVLTLDVLEASGAGQVGDTWGEGLK